MESFGIYLINFYGLMPLILLDKKIAILWHESIAWGLIDEAYEDNYHDHYIGYRKMKRFTCEAMDKIGYGYITDECNKMIYYWNIELPKNINGMDINHQI